MPPTCRVWCSWQWGPKSQVYSFLNGEHIYDHFQQVFEEAEAVNSLKVWKLFQVFIICLSAEQCWVPKAALQPHRLGSEPKICYCNASGANDFWLWGSCWRSTCCPKSRNISRKMGSIGIIGRSKQAGLPPASADFRALNETYRDSGAEQLLLDITSLYIIDFRGHLWLIK